MQVNGTDIYMTRGDSESIGVTVTGYQLAPGDKVELTIRRDIDSRAVVHKVITEFDNNTALIPIFPEDTSNLRFGKYLYDIQLTYAGCIKTIVRPSIFEIGKEVTYAAD